MQEGNQVSEAYDPPDDVGVLRISEMPVVQKCGK
jgi:hypothetical protein